MEACTALAPLGGQSNSTPEACQAMAAEGKKAKLTPARKERKEIMRGYSTSFVWHCHRKVNGGPPRTSYAQLKSLRISKSGSRDGQNMNKNVTSIQCPALWIRCNVDIPQLLQLPSLAAFNRRPQEKKESLFFIVAMSPAHLLPHNHPKNSCTDCTGYLARTDGSLAPC